MDIGLIQETKTILKSLVLSSPNGMTVDRLNRDYRETVGSWIPYERLGYPSLELFLKSIPDSLVVVGHGKEAKVGFVSNTKLKHINEMVSRQKNTTRDRKFAVLNESAPRVHGDQHHNFISRSASHHVSQLTNGSMRNSYKLKPEEHLNIWLNDSQKNPSNNTLTANVLHKILETKTQMSSQRVVNNEQKTKTFTPSNASNPSSGANDCRQQNTNLTKTRTTGILDNQHSMDYSYNKQSVDRRKTHTRGKLDDEIVNKEECHRHNSKRSDQNQGKYYAINSPKLNGQQSHIEKPEIKDDLVGTVTESEKDSDVLHHNEPKQQCTTAVVNDEDEAIPEFAATNLVFQVDHPEATVPLGKKIPECVMPAELTKGAVIGIFIAEIHSPFKFWFHIHKENHELDTLMNRLERFYSNLEANDLVIAKSAIAPGQICAALFNDMWHRAEILTNEYNEKVKVHFVDYGTVSEVGIRNIKYLPTIFGNTPVQAFRGCLSHIKPVSLLWPKSAIREFLSLVSDVLLYAQVVQIDEKDKTVYMVLCDTNGEKTIQVNKTLVDRGHAKLDSEWDENKIAKNGYRKRHPKEIFPTFEMLETGEYPSLYELECLLAQGIDYEQFSKNVLLHFNSNDCDGVPQSDSVVKSHILKFKLLDTNPFKCDIISEIASLKIFNK